jgi:hypothetical protein
MTATVAVYGFTQSGFEHRGTAPAPVLLKPLPLIDIYMEVPFTPNTNRTATVADLPEIFCASSSILDGCEVLVCRIDEGGGYEGNAHIIYQKGRDLFEVEASHCSCHGFEGQWQPTRIPRKYLQLRMDALTRERYWRKLKFNIDDPVSAIEKHFAALLWYWQNLPTDERPE